MNFFYDLHIHSCLSPCSDDDMTPNNIVNMAMLKGLDIIAVSDHNATGNVRAVMTVGARAGMLVVPAVELCTAEEIHMLCLFPTVEAAEAFSRILYSGMAVPDNRPDIFGHQFLLDENDLPAGEDPRMLLAASGLDVSSALHAIRALGGVAVPAHVERDAYSMPATLGTIPPEYGFRVVEASTSFLPPVAPNTREGQIPDAGVFHRLANSDAHHLWDISEPEHILTLPERSVSALLHALRTGEGLPECGKDL